MTDKERSARIIKFVNSHPLINVAMLCRMAGGADVHNFSNALNGQRAVSKKFLTAMEKVLADYGFKKQEDQP